MRIAEQIGHILGISERQVHRRLNDRETVVMATLKAILLNNDLGERLETAVRALEMAMHDVRRIDPQFGQVVDELAYRVKQWHADSAACELERYCRLRKRPNRDDFVYRNVSFTQFQQECKDHEECRIEAIAELRKKLTGSSEPRPDPEETEPEPPSGASAIADADTN